MTALAAGLAILSLALFVWSYAVYPLWIIRLSARRGTPARDADTAPCGPAEVILAAADEESVIGARVQNLLAQAGVERISIGCDGCGDATAARAREAAGDGPVRVVEFGERRGKAAVVNDLVRESTADVLVFTDANTRFEP